MTNSPNADRNLPTRQALKNPKDQKQFQCDKHQKHKKTQIRCNTKFACKQRVVFPARTIQLRRVKQARLKFRRKSASIHVSRISYWLLGHPNRRRREHKRSRPPNLNRRWGLLLPPKGSKSDVQPLSAGIHTPRVSPWLSSRAHRNKPRRLQRSATHLRRCGRALPSPTRARNEAEIDPFRWAAAHRHLFTGGAAGSKRSKRKRWQQEQQPSDDQYLAQSLLTVLQSWQQNKGCKRPHCADDTGQQHRKTHQQTTARDSAPAVPNTSSLASSLMAVLQECIQRNHNDEIVAQKVKEALQKPSRLSEPPGTTRHDWSHSGRQSYPQAHKATTTRWQRHARTSQPRWYAPITAFVQSEWSSVPAFQPFVDIATDIKAGKDISKINITEISQWHDVQEARTMWHSYGCTGSLTLILSGEAKDTEGAKHTRLTLSRGKAGQKVEDVSLLFLGDAGKAINTKPSIKVDPSKLPKIDRCTLRVAAPSEYRQLFLKDFVDKPKHIAADLALRSPQIQASSLTGGQWSQQLAGKHSLIVGFLKLPRKEAEILLKDNGSKGVFTNILETAPARKPITWFSRAKEESSEAYFHRCVQTAKKRNTALFYKKSGSNNLGTVPTKEEEAEVHRTTFLGRGMPSTWEGEELISFLEQQGWKEIEIITKRFHSKKPEWRFLAKAPQADLNCYNYDIEEDMTITFVKAPTKPAKAVWEKSLRGVPRNWHQGNSTDSSSVRGPQLPATAGKARTVINEGTEPSERERSPRRFQGSTSNEPKIDGNHRCPTNPDEACKQGWSLADYGGNGDCCFRAVAGAQAWAQQSENMSKDAARLAGAQLRMLAMKHARKHQDRLRAFWALDTEETTSERAGRKAPDTLQDWIENMEKQQTYVDGLALQCLSEKTGLCLIIFRKDSDGWVRFVFAPKFSYTHQPQGVACGRKGASPAVLVLENKHYTALLPGAHVEVPTPWLFETQNKQADFSGAGEVSSEPSTPSAHTLCADEPDTPSVHTIRQDPAGPLRMHVVGTTENSFSSFSPKTGSEKSPATRDALRDRAPSFRTQLTNRSRAATIRSTAAPAADVNDSGEPQLAKAHNVPDQYTWTCNLCCQVLRNRLKRSLACSRRRHIAKSHPGKARLVRPAFKQHAQLASASSAIPVSQRAWECPKCHQGLPWMPKTALRASQLAHEKACYNLSARQMRKRCYKRASWQAKHQKLQEQNAAAKRGKTDEAIRIYNQTGPGFCFRIPAARFGHKQDHCSCARCTLVAQKWKDIRLHRCTGPESRQKVMQSPSRRGFWKRKRQLNPDVVSFLIENWQMTEPELMSLEKTLDAKKAKKGFCPPPNSVSLRRLCAPASEWIKDLTADGDVHPQPGPQATRGPQSMSIAMINADGANNAWAVCRWAVVHRPSVVIMQEICMPPDKQSDIAQFLSRHGYRSWFAVPRPVLSRSGCAQTFGGVAILVRHDKPAHLVQTHIRPDGQALMLQLAHALVVGVYLAPRSMNSDILPTLDEWAAAAKARCPICYFGDFNQLTSFGQRWSDLHGFGAVRAVHNSEGQECPTRWDGQRCIDWIWTSHPLMLHNLGFEATKFSDHKMIQCSLSYQQETVQSFKVIQTRKLAPSPEVTREMWQTALKEVWASASVPPSTSTDEEWEAFCTLAENAQVNAMLACGCKIPKPKHKRPKGTDIQVQPAESKSFRWTQEASFRELRLRKLLGRATEALSQVQKGKSVPHRLQQRIWTHVWVCKNKFQTLQQIQTWCQSELQICLKEAQQQRLTHWRDNMRSTVKNASKWIKKTNCLPVTSVFDPGFRNGAATATSQESLEAVLAFWQTVWNRDRPDPEEAFEFWHEGMPPSQSFAWTPIAAEELLTQAKRQDGSAAGVDGWSGSEISSWPLEAWNIFAVLLSRWFARQEMPRCFSKVRQCLLQKPNAKLRSTDGAIGAKDLRPISVQSCLWRVVASAWTRRPETRAWVKSWAHRTACGGLEGRGVAEAIDTLLQEFEKPNGGVLVSLDYAKCFDTINPAFALRCLEHVGCPKEILAALQMVWKQERWLCFQGDILPKSVDVSTSIPQGDALSPLTLLAVMAGLTGRVLQKEGNHTLVTFLDDRNFVTKTPERAAQLWETWKDMSAKVGLQENNSKVQVVPRKAAFRTRLEQAGFPTNSIVPSARVLGVDFTARLGAVHRPTQDQRVSDAAQRIARIDLLPLPYERKAFLIKCVAIPKAIWGAWNSTVPCKKLSLRLKKAAGGGHVAAANNLFSMLTGHGLSTEFCAGFHAFLHLAKQVRKSPRPWPRKASRGTWLGTVRRWLSSLGWHEQGAWKWFHPSVNHTIDFDAQVQTNDKLEHHQLRESWRRRQFRLFLATPRRDAQMLQEAQYNEARVTLARKTFQGSNTHARACMMGAVVSDARFARISNPQAPVLPCQWCSSEAAPTWRHMCWECEGFSNTRTFEPSDLFQQILGWPMGINHEYDAAVLAHLADVRRRLLDRRYRAI